MITERFCTCVKRRCTVSWRKLGHQWIEHDLDGAHGTRWPWCSTLYWISGHTSQRQKCSEGWPKPYFLLLMHNRSYNPLKAWSSKILLWEYNFSMMSLILFLTNHYYCLKPIVKLSVISLTIFGVFWYICKCFGADAGTPACFIAAARARNSHSVGCCMINLPSVDILAVVIAQIQARLFLVSWLRVWSSNKDVSHFRRKEREKKLICFVVLVFLSHWRVIS